VSVGERKVNSVSLDLVAFAGIFVIYAIISGLTLVIFAGMFLRREVQDAWAAPVRTQLRIPLPHATFSPFRTQLTHICLSLFHVSLSSVSLPLSLSQIEKYYLRSERHAKHEAEVARLLKLFDAVGTSGKASQRNDDDAAAAASDEGGGEGKDRPRPSSSAAPLDDSGSGNGLKVKPQGGRGGVFGSLQRRISVGTIAHEVTHNMHTPDQQGSHTAHLTFFACGHHRSVARTQRTCSTA
jgi:hypothetical protein